MKMANKSVLTSDLKSLFIWSDYMIEQRIKEQLSVEYESRLLIHDLYAFSAVFDYAHLLTELGFEVIVYGDIEQFRYTYETELKNSGKKVAVIVVNHFYIPFDIKKAFFEVYLSLEAIYPKLNADVISEYINDLKVMDYAYDCLYEDCRTADKTKNYIKRVVMSPENIKKYIATVDKQLAINVHEAHNYNDWINIAKQNAKLEYYAAQIGFSRNQQYINDAFESFILNDYQKLSGVISKNAPAILPKAIDLIAGGKVALVVADGMSLFDYEILSRHMPNFTCDDHCSYALIPTTTSISRQSLLSGKYPQQLENPFSLAKEELGFYETAVDHGYTKQQSFYGRGYNAIPGPLVRFAAIVINDIDDMVHGQMQGRQGMYNDVTLFAKSGKLQTLCGKLLDRGFTVYLTADHGNTHCIGGGAAQRTGVETETKSKRMIVLKDFAEITSELVERTIRYPGYYMNKTYQYLICKGNTSFDNIGNDVMTHGGITLEEVIVPFVKIRRENKNG